MEVSSSFADNGNKPILTVVGFTAAAASAVLASMTFTHVWQYAPSIAFADDDNFDDNKAKEQEDDSKVNNMDHNNYYTNKLSFVVQMKTIYTGI